MLTSSANVEKGKTSSGEYYNNSAPPQKKKQHSGLDEGGYSGTVEKCADCEYDTLGCVLMHIQSNGWEVWNTEESKVIIKTFGLIS